VAWRVVHANLVGPEGHECVSIVEKAIHRRRGLDLQTEKFTKRHRVLVQRKITAVEVDRDLELTLRLGHTGHMVDMAVREENVFDVEVPRPNDLE
jgi:hypothetical protein